MLWTCSEFKHLGCWIQQICKFINGPHTPNVQLYLSALSLSTAFCWKVVLAIWSFNNLKGAVLADWGVLTSEISKCFWNEGPIGPSEKMMQSVSQHLFFEEFPTKTISCISAGCPIEKKGWIKPPQNQHPMQFPVPRIESFLGKPFRSIQIFSRPVLWNSHF